MDPPVPLAAPRAPRNTPVPTVPTAVPSVLKVSKNMLAFGDLCNIGEVVSGFARTVMAEWAKS
jgi:hypothetical protein